MSLNKKFKHLYFLNYCDVNQREITEINVKSEENDSPTTASVSYKDFGTVSYMYVAFYKDGSFKSASSNLKMIFSNEREAVKQAIKNFKSQNRVDSLLEYYQHTDFDEKYPELFV